MKIAMYELYDIKWYKGSVYIPDLSASPNELPSQWETTATDPLEAKDIAETNYGWNIKSYKFRITGEATEELLGSIYDD